MWEPGQGDDLAGAYYKIIPKITNKRWKEFARKGLRLSQNDIDEIVENYRGDVKEQKIKMCQCWQESMGKDASVELIYQVLNHFLFPKKCPAPGMPAEKEGPMVSLAEQNSGSRMKAVAIDKREDYCSSVINVVESCTQSFYEEHKSLSSVYEMKGRKGKKGNVLIINNTFSHTVSSRREGSEVDAENMENLWEKMGCKVSVQKDLHAKDILFYLKRFSDDSDGFGYCVVVIMSHGAGKDGEDVVFGNDNKRIRVQEIFDMFNNKKCPRLIDVPKLFFFQCCRGQDTDSGVVVGNRATAEPVDMETQPVATLLPDSCILGGQNSLRPTDESDAAPTTPEHERLPVVSDMLMFYATQPGNKAFRNTVNGSWFINAICNVFLKHAKNEHVADLMTQVNEAVAAKSSSGTATCCKEMSHIESNLRKKLYLYPGIEI